MEKNQRQKPENDQRLAYSHMLLPDFPILQLEILKMFAAGRPRRPIFKKRNEFPHRTMNFPAFPRRKYIVGRAALSNTYMGSIQLIYLTQQR